MSNLKDVFPENEMYIFYGGSEELIDTIINGNSRERDEAQWDASPYRMGRIKEVTPFGIKISIATPPGEETKFAYISFPYLHNHFENKE